ncbi:MAG: hypothetical protein K9L28_11065 [Synergistales bacterium]|nr:hypothetical protein [Synergistales bacterium]
MAWPRSSPPTAHTQKQDVFALILGAPLCYLLLHWLYGRFLLPEGIDRIVQFRISSCCGFADSLFATPMLTNMLYHAVGWLGPEVAWPLLSTFGALAVAAVLVNVLRHVPATPLLRGLYALLLLGALPLLFLALSSPAGALALALAGLAAHALLLYSLEGTTFWLFIAGLSLGLAPFAHPMALGYLLGLAAGLWLVFPGGVQQKWALYVVVFTPFCLLAAGWGFLHWLYGRQGSLFPMVAPPLQGGALPVLSFLVLLLLGLCIGLCILRRHRRSGERHAPGIFARFWWIHLAIWCGMWLFLVRVDAYDPLFLLSFGLFLAAGFLPALPRGGGQVAVAVLLVLFAGVTWWELPQTSPVVRAWQGALAGEHVYGELYGPHLEAASFLQRHLGEGEAVASPSPRARLVWFLSGMDRPFVLPARLDSEGAPSPAYRLLPAGGGGGGSAPVFSNGAWHLVDPDLEVTR